MYTGARALFNVVRSFTLPGLRAGILDFETMEIDELGLVKVRVNSRSPPRMLGAGRKAGMISVQLISPGISGVLYALLRITSHFGCGHVEIAFYETNERIIVFGIRDIVRSNIERIGLQKTFCKLTLFSDDDEVDLLRRILQELRVRGVSCNLASPKECVTLALNQSLLKPEKCDRVIKALTKRYRRITKQLAMHNQ